MFEKVRRKGGGGDNSSKSESSGPHSAMGSHGIYKHILFCCYPIEITNMTRPRYAEVGPGPLIG